VHELDVSNNPNLPSAAIAPALGGAGRLRHLALRSCQLGPTLPPFVTAAAQLSYLDVSFSTVRE
jgi:hypothetical protein